MQFTSEQRAAITTCDRNVIVTAGAGSGKTRVLVERFIHLLDANPAWSLPSVVAITFTEKAAREMRDRVHQALRDRVAAALESGDQAALDRWLACEADLTRARIGTIHSLCASVLRANPAEARLDPRFSVLDENDAAILREDAVEAALAELGAEGAAGFDLLRAYDLRQVRRVLETFADRSMAADVRAVLDTTPEELRARWYTQWRESVHDVAALVQGDRELRAALEWIAPEDLPPDDLRADVWRAVLSHVPDLYSDDPDTFAAALNAMHGAIKLSGGTKANWGSKERLDEAKEVLRAIRDRLREPLDAMLPPPDARDDDAAQWLLAWRDAIQVAAAHYDQLKAERGALDFDDLEARACALLCENPAVAARYRAEFNHVLVDEFQDTNSAQRDIVYALAGVTQDRSDDPPDQSDRAGRLFVVGDPKQSIYAFRGADVSVFGAVRGDLTRDGGADLPLAMSFRTQSRLVDAFNAIFGRILGTESGTAARYDVELGTPMRAFRPAEDFHACPVTVFAFPRPEEDPPSGSIADMIREWEAVTLADHIQQLIADELPVYDREANDGAGGYRPLRYGDVAILFQAMSHVPEYEAAFKAAGLPYITVAGKGYYNRQEVWDLLHLLRALYNPADDLALAAALRSPLFGLSDDALLALRLAESGPRRERRLLWDALHDDAIPEFPDLDVPARDFARSVLRDLRDVAGRATIAELLGRVLEVTGYLATLTGLPDGQRRRGNVEKLIALARQSGRVSLGEFTAYARELETREVREGEAVIEAEDAVQLMSVHKSKGLEFPVVVLADASWARVGGGGDPFLLDPEIGAACKLPVTDPDAEEPDPFAYACARDREKRRERAERKRLLYVGATRAQDYLIVSGSLHRAQSHAWLSQWLAALDVDSDDLETGDDPVIATYDWGQAAIVKPQTVRQVVPEPYRDDGHSAGWHHPAVAAREAIPGIAPELPPLLDPVPVAPDAPARSLSATHIAALGRASFYDPVTAGQDRFRHAVLHDAPDPVRPLPEREPSIWQLRRVVGQMVHRALQVWALPDREDEASLRDRLRAYAWNAHLSDPELVERATGEALALLHRFAHSALRAQLDAADQVHREVPFMLRYGGRTLHGVVDVLFQDANGWHVLDYKTAPVSMAGAAENARRYYLQVGIYARAVAGVIGGLPAVSLYYVHPGA